VANVASLVRNDLFGVQSSTDSRLVGLMDNLLQPILVGADARIPLLPLFFASIGGLTYYGFLGLFLGPILLAAVLETFAIYQEEYQHQRSDLIVSPDSFPMETSDIGLSRTEGRAQIT
jgi:hypothetical protein